MYKSSKIFKITLLLCAISTTSLLLLVLLPNFHRTTATNQLFLPKDGQEDSLSLSSVTLSRRNFTEEEMSRMSVLGRWLLSAEGSPPPSTINRKQGPYLILVWNHGPFLERRHIRRFSSSEFSPWEDCSVQNCILSYDPKDLQKADAVIFHLHLTKSSLQLPRKTRVRQRWIFLTDESPMHTFLYRNQRLADYNSFFNWSMSYRMDSDVPVPYGRTVLRVPPRNSSADLQDHRNFLKRSKTKLVAILASNCGGNNGRWEYVRYLKEFLGDKLDVFGKCLNGDTTSCPGHFDRNCPALDAYKFYLAFENSNCREYLTEKVFWNGYRKSSVPIILGAPKEDCEKLLPPQSFLHVQDFANPSTLAHYIKYLDRNDDEYLKYHYWRAYYKVINEHGYFGSRSVHYCRVCEALHYNSPTEKVYENLNDFWSIRRDCSLSLEKYVKNR